MKTGHNKISKHLKSQQGMTAISLVVLLFIGAMIILIGLRLFPIYLEHFKVKAHLKDLAHEVGISKKTNDEIIKTYFNRLQIDDVVNVTPDNFFIERDKDGGMVLAVEYEVRTPGLGNVNMVVSFEDEVEVR